MEDKELIIAKKKIEKVSKKIAKVYKPRVYKYNLCLSKRR
jgi:hypothetical protein